MKKVKPIDTSISLIYACPKCSAHNWISLKAAQTKGYRIVCGCDEVFKPKLVDKIKIIHTQNKQPIKSKTITTADDTKNIGPTEDIIKRCYTVLSEYGYTKSECEQLISKVYADNPTDNVLVLITLCLKEIGEKNEQKYQTV